MTTRPSDGPTVERLWAALREVEDPEWPISLVDLGLVKGLALDRGVARVELTFTSAGCPFVAAIGDDVRARLLAEPGVADVEVDVTWAPWSPDDITPAGRARFVSLGVAP